MGKIILDLCGGTGSWSKPYKDAGYDVRLVTLPVQDVRTYTPPDNVYGILAAPPCDEFSIAKDHKLKRDLEKGMEIVNACLDIIKICDPVFYAIENPVGYLQQQIGKPAYIFQPWWFGNAWTKRTALWGNFNEPKRQYRNWHEVPKNEKLYIRPGRTKPSIAFLHKSAIKYMPELEEYKPETDATFRAITPPGFAKAFYEANK